MEFESDPATEFLKREREELGDLENEIISPNGTLEYFLLFPLLYFCLTYHHLDFS